MIGLMDCTLRDGANVVGKGFDARLTRLMLDGMIRSGIDFIEMGHALGLGSPVVTELSDEEYLSIANEYASRAKIGMFMGYKNANADLIQKAKESGLHFIRVGANAGDGEEAIKAVKMVKDAGLVCRYSLMKAYVVSEDELADEAYFLQKNGVDGITIMDSAGTMRPEQVASYVRTMKDKCSVPIAFHGHNNLGLAVANALAAYKAGADELDCCLMGMARSAGNIPLEIIVPLLQECGEFESVNFYGLLNYIDEKLIPAMEEKNFHCAISPIDLICGISGCHSNFLSLFKKVAKEEQASLYPLIMEVSKRNRKDPSEEQIRTIAKIIEK